MALGIAKGIARHFREELVVSERSCMLRGDPCCVFAFVVMEPAALPR
jgi:predicted hydrocarbon binding protein